MPRTWGLFGLQPNPFAPAQPAAPRPKSLEEKMAEAYDAILAREQPETQEVTVAGVPEGAVLSAGTNHSMYQLKHPAFTEKIADLESRVLGEYDARNLNDDGTIGAWGRYQIRGPGLVDARLKQKNPATGRYVWTGKYGIDGDAAFFANHEGQDRAYDDYLDAKERYTRAAGNLAHQGIVIEKGMAQPAQRGEPAREGEPIWLNKASLMAASHRVGEHWLAEYLRWAEANGWRTADAKLPDIVHIWNGKNDDGTIKWNTVTNPAKIQEMFEAAEYYMSKMQDIEY